MGKRLLYLESFTKVVHVLFLNIFGIQLCKNKSYTAKSESELSHPGPVSFLLQSLTDTNLYILYTTVHEFAIPVKCVEMQPGNE